LEKSILHLLVIDDSPDDAELPVNVLRKAGYMLKSQRVQDTTSMQHALDKGSWDLVISKHMLPHYGAQQALEAMKRAHRHMPLIILTEKINDEELAKIMRAGARDVVLKSDLGRLAPAIERELAVVRERETYQQSNERLREIEGKHQAMIDGAREAICYSHDGMHVDVNRAYLRLFKYEGLAELEGVPVLDLIDRSDHDRFKEYLRKVAKGNHKSDEPQRFQALRKDGSKVPVEIGLSLIDLGGETCTQIVVSDVAKHAVASGATRNADRDVVTGTYDRERFLRELGKAIEQAKSGGKNSALIYLELDGLKEVNEKHGHDTGDELLREIARQFQAIVVKDGMISRFGGDEFAVLLPGATLEQAQRLAEGLKQGVTEAATRVSLAANAVNATTGLIMIERTSGSVEKILSLAYGACDQAKKQKKPVPVVSAPKAREADAESARVRVWRERIQRALDHDSFQLVYQPVINLIGDPSEYYEVLIRLAGENDELVAAGEFMPIAERSGQALAIDDWVLRHALTGLAQLHKEGQQASFFINVSSQAVTDDGFPSRIQETLKNNKLDGRHVILEADESCIEQDEKHATAFIRAVNKLGCRLSLDNFGARLALLGRLRELPIEFLKIDGTLARDAGNDNIKQIVLKTIVQIAKLLNKKTIGKCVEDEETLSLLYSYELDYLQGNYFQHADVQPEYKFAGETTLSSEDPLGGWPPNP
jgi:diguanylate cyclase (GGDEF)-like protein/PAS domain S-box-containing protein